MRHLRLPLAIGLALPALLFAAGARAQQPAERVRLVNASENPVLSAFRWRSIGPAGQGGRVDDIAVDPTDPRVWYVGFATGGLWRTRNHGTTFEPIFDELATHSIGAVAVAPSDSRVLYVGTGEANNRQSSSFGAGVYRSNDGGDSFTFVGLSATQSIARVLVHPADPNTVWVAAAGPLFASGPDRGVFKTTDGGRRWRRVLAVDDDTGATDLVLDPSDPTRLFAATYQRRRSTCCFVGGGPGSGIWSSQDGGETWTRVVGNGLPAGTMGRIALAMTPANPSVVYAQIEVAANRARPLNDEEREDWEEREEAGELSDPEWSGVWRSMDGGRTWEFRSNQNRRPMYFSQIRVSPRDPDLVYVVDLDVWKSRDGGQTWEELDGFGHVDQHAFWIDPRDHDHLLIGNDGGVDVSYDQGETWESLRLWAVGQPYHASVDLQRPYRVCTGLQDNGTWCGPSSVRNGPILAQDWFRAGGGDGFYSQIDPTDPDVLYVESQNGNISRLDLSTGQAQSIRPRAPPRGEGGRGGGPPNIVPEPREGTEVRWNWNTPFMLSPHNPRILYAGGNRFFISRDRGETWTMSPDLTKALDRERRNIMGVAYSLPPCRQLDRGRDCILSKNDGISAWGTAVTVAESPVLPGVLWMGTDDGNIQVSRDGGARWTEVSRNLPGGTTELYVSRIEASWHDAATAYVSLDGHKAGDLSPYVYVTRDYGVTWEDLTSDLPRFGNVNTVRQDPRNPDLLYVGTEFGFFVSLDEGRSWHRFMTGLPVVRVDDVLVHPRENDLVLATHGRSIWIMDDITALQSATEEVRSDLVHLFRPREAVLWKRDRRRERAVTGDKNWLGESAPAGTVVSFWLRERNEEVRITIEDLVNDEVFRTLEVEGHAGLNRVQWNLRGDPPEDDDGPGPFATPGIYRVRLTVDEEDYTTTVEVLEDAWLGQP